MLLLELFEDDHPKRNAELKKAYQDAIYQDYADDDIKADAFLTKHYSKLVVALNKFASGDRIYRGVEDKKNFSAMVVDPTKAIRVAANTSNYTNMLVSSVLPSWKGWPPRNQALICTVRVSIAQSYGGYHSSGPHVVLPFGDPVIGVCSNSDFWESFSDGIYPPELNDFIERLSAYTLQRKINTSTPEALAADLKQMGEISKSEPYILEYFSLWERNILNAPSLLEKLDAILDPKASGFKMVNLSQLNGAGANNEVWVSAPSLMVREGIVANWLQRQQDEIKI